MSTLLGWPKMAVMPNDDFPRAGSRARRMQRFERDLRAWLRTPEGRFAAWEARRQIERREVVTTSTPRTGP
jgi:hypothetical protein